MTIKTDGFHHVAYRCRDAKETVEFYQSHLNMDCLLYTSPSPRDRG